MRRRLREAETSEETRATIHGPEEGSGTSVPARRAPVSSSRVTQMPAGVGGYPTLPIARRDVACPRCDTDLVRRVPRRGVVERLISKAYIYPFRCQLCSQRFRAMRWGVRYDRAPVDRREFERLSVTMPVRVGAKGDGGQQLLELRDISMGGAGIEMAEPAVVGDVLALTLFPRGLERDPIHVEAAVVRSARDRLAGFEFLRMAKVDQEELSHFIWAELMTAMGHLPLKPKKLGLRIATPMSERA